MLMHHPLLHPISIMATTPQAMFGSRLHTHANLAVCTRGGEWWWFPALPLKVMWATHTPTINNSSSTKELQMKTLRIHCCAGINCGRYICCCWQVTNRHQGSIEN